MKKICKNCKKEFECYDKPKSKSRPQGHNYKRPFRAVTCSNKCSRDWQYNRFNPKNKKDKK